MDESQGFGTIVHSEREKTRSTSTEAGDSKLNNVMWWGRLINGLSEKRG